MNTSTTTLRLSLASLSPTSFPALEQALIDESNARTLPFSEFLNVTSFADEVSHQRHLALSLLTPLRHANATDIAHAIEQLNAEAPVHPHRSVYLLYLLGAYAEAGNAVEAALQRTDAHAFASIARMREVYASALNHAASPVVHELTTKIDCVEQSVRIKRPAAIVAKLVSLHLRSRDRGASLDEWLSVPITPLYDLAGCRIIVDSSGDSRPFADLVSIALNVCRAFSDSEGAEIHRRYSFGDIEGASILFATRDGVPVQVQLWNVAASRYEWLCHGNHKVHHRLSPLVPDWREFCARPIEPRAYARAIARRWAVCDL